ncbi:MAG: D-alanine--D-alanine ligase [Bacteroidota bacterium]|nr:D-alanine--D-alanine ligase [Candidatus Kapabacteria bacterium]MDW8220215.1 D-alanine--D-alanine ligase [Bacteroidota bacterium]
MNIVVLMGGISAERNVSFASGKAIAQALTTAGHTVVALDPAQGASGILDVSTLQPFASQELTLSDLQAFSPSNLLDCVQSEHIRSADIVFLALHGKYGEDGYIQAMLDIQGKRYTGSKMLASALAMSKSASKRIFHSVNIPTPTFLTVQASALCTPEAKDEIAEELRATLGERLVIKPDTEGSTVGISLIYDGNLDDIQHGLEEAAHWSDTVVVEQLIDGRELTVAVLGEETLPIIEIQTDTGFYDYSHKYTKGRTEYICPADIPSDVEDFVQQLALAAHEALGCTAYSRVDFRLNDDLQAFCLEVNTLPGMTETSLVPKAAAAAGIDFSTLCETILRLS